MTRYCQGDAKAFHELYQTVAPRIRSYLRKLCGQPALADDMLQLTFLKIHKARGSFLVGADPLPWMYAIAHRTFLDEVQKVRYKYETELAAASEPPAPVPDDEPDSELAQATMRALQDLPVNQRQALILTKLEGKSIAEAAAIAGSTPGAIKLRAHRGYETLRQKLGGKSAL